MFSAVSVKISFTVAVTEGNGIFAAVSVKISFTVG